MSHAKIAENAARVRTSLPNGVLLVAAVKTRTADEARAAVDAGISILGHNYVQEAETMAAALDRQVQWHFIGHLQRNKAKRAVALFHMIETIDSAKIARAVNRHCAGRGKIMPTLVEVNIGQEPTKSGVMPDEVEGLVREIADLENIRVQGLMTMAPYSPDPEDSRPYFRRMKNLFDRLAGTYPLPADTGNAQDQAAFADAGPRPVQMRYLSMGMSHTYQVAIEEGANIVRVGTAIFGER